MNAPTTRAELRLLALTMPLSQIMEMHFDGSADIRAIVMGMARSSEISELDKRLFAIFEANDGERARKARVAYCLSKVRDGLADALEAVGAYPGVLDKLRSTPTEYVALEKALRSTINNYGERHTQNNNWPRFFDAADNVYTVDTVYESLHCWNFVTDTAGVVGTLRYPAPADHAARRVLYQDTLFEILDAWCAVPPTRSLS